MPEQLLSQLTSSDIVAFGLGTALLLFGRRLFFLALGALGFLFGLALANQLFPASGLIELGLAVLFGFGCAVLALVAQKLAVAVGGFLAGGAAGLVIASFFENAFASHAELFLLASAAIGAILGTLVAPTFFEASLAVVTSFAGALLIVTRAQMEPPYESWLLLGLIVAGLMIQTRRRAGRVRYRPRPAES